MTKSTCLVCRINPWLDRQRGKLPSAKRILKIFSKKALQEVRAKDARAYAEQLRLLKISEDSEEWRNAWKLFYSG
jgi:hypothetical protein